MAVLPLTAIPTEPELPTSRGPLSEFVLTHLQYPPHALPSLAVDVIDPLSEDDLQLALYCCYELHYRGFEQVDPEWEWEPSLLGFRRQLESAFERALRSAVRTPQLRPGDDIASALRALVDRADGPSLSAY